MTPAEFWGKTTEFSNKSGVERTLSYLYMMAYMTKQKGIKMTKEWLGEQGKNIEFFPGVLTWFKRINDFGDSCGVKVEHYLISSGNKEIVDGCPIAKEFKVVYACEFLFDDVTKEPIWPKLAINYTQKTQYFFRISKGVYDATDDAGVNEKRPDRRVPYSNIIYIGDGMNILDFIVIAIFVICLIVALVRGIKHPLTRFAGDAFSAIFAFFIAIFCHGADEKALVLLQDGDRPRLKESYIEDNFKNAEAFGASVTAIPVSDSVAISKWDGILDGYIPREEVYLLQTPQAFQLSLLHEAMEIAAKSQRIYTDEGSLVLQCKGVNPHIVKGDKNNIKITTKEDQASFEEGER